MWPSYLQQQVSKVAFEKKEFRCNLWLEWGDFMTPSRWQEATGIQVCMSHLDRIMQASDKHVSSLHFRIYRDDQQRFFVEARYSWSGWYSMNLTIWRSAFSHRNVDIQSSNLPLIVYKTGRKEIEAHSYLAPVYHCEREIEGVEFFWVLHQQPTGEVAWQNPDIGNSSQCQIMPRKNEHRALRHGQGTKGAGDEISQMR